MRLNVSFPKGLIAASGVAVVAAAFLLVETQVKREAGTAETVVGVVSAQATSTATETLPPLPEPAIRNVPGGGEQVVVSNRGRGEPVEVRATLKLGLREYGDGHMVITNTSGKPALAIRGEWILVISTGDVLRDSWDWSGSASVLRGGEGLQTGEKVELPAGGPIAPVISPPHFIKRVGVRITGAAFGDKTWWGEEGLRVYQKAEHQIQALTIEAERVYELAAKMTPQEFEAELNSPISENRLAQSSKMNLTRTSQFVFQRILCDETHSLLPGYLQLLETAKDKGRAFRNQ